MPRVSVLVLTYRHEEFVAETLASVLEQDFASFEVIVADDGSPDGTAAVVRELAAQDARIVPVLHETNTGLAGNQNRALAAARGEFVAWLGGDDLMLPGKLTKQVAVLDARPDATICCHDGDVFRSCDGASLGRFSDVYTGRRGFREGGPELVLQPSRYVWPSSFLVRRSAIPAEGYDTRLRFTNEWVVDVAVLSQGPCVPINEVLGRYRRHGGNVTSSPELRQSALEEVLMALAIIQARHPELTRLIRRQRASQLLTAALGAGSRRATLTLVGAAFRDGGVSGVAVAVSAALAARIGRRRLGVSAPGA